MLIISLDVLNSCCYIKSQIRRSSAVEQLTVNQLVVGSIPTAGANYLIINVFLGSDWQKWDQKVGFGINPL